MTSKRLVAGDAFVFLRYLMFDFPPLVGVLFRLGHDCIGVALFMFYNLF